MCIRDSDEAGGFILVHALDCDDVDAAARGMKDRYEAPLRAILEGVQS